MKTIHIRLGNHISQVGMVALQENVMKEHISAFNWQSGESGETGPLYRTHVPPWLF